MATFKQNFDSYKVWYYSDFSYTSLIYCYQENVFVGRMAFYEDGANLPQNSQVGGKPYLNFHQSRFDDITKMLRYESPLYLFYNDGNHVGILATSTNEPTGEQE